ncbi:MAG: glycosyl transferase, partial [Pseudomonadota bacterium]|nr:glycosyl transferase [Pseudomonadota bacterium]
MADFYQNGIVTTLHNLTDRPVEDLERELMSFSRLRPMSLVLPSLFSELEGPALSNIIDEVAQVPYLNEIVIGLDRADQSQYEFAQKFFSKLPQHHRILWNDGPRLRKLDEMLAEKGLSPTEMGKGRNVWYCYGYVLASGRAESVALH